jgi:hypothetical protein
MKGTVKKKGTVKNTTESTEAQRQTAELQIN